MCEPATITAVTTWAVSNAAAIAAASSAASAGVMAYGQHQQGVAQTKNALSAQRDANAGLVEQMHQQDQASTDQMVDRSRKAVTDLGQTMAIFGDSGLSGNTQDRIAGNVEGSAYADLTTMERNRANRTNQSVAEGSAIHARTQSALNAAPRPSILGTGLQIASAGADYYARTHPPRAS